MCDHQNLQPNFEIHHLDNGDGDVSAHTLHVRIICLNCGMRFRFAGRMAEVPVTIQDVMIDNRGAWVSDDGEVMGVMVVPVDPGFDVGQMQTVGNA